METAEKIELTPMELRRAFWCAQQYHLHQIRHRANAVPVEVLDSSDLQVMTEHVAAATRYLRAQQQLENVLEPAAAEDGK